MNRFIFTFAIAAITVVAINTDAQASGNSPSGSNGKGSSNSKGSSISKSGSISKGISSNKTINHVHLNKVHVSSSFIGCHRVRTYCGWSSYCWYPQYGCYAFFCPLDGQWYYWSAACGHYIPVTYIAVYRPTTIGFVGTGTTFGVSGSFGTPALPLGATSVAPMALPKNQSQ